MFSVGMATYDDFDGVYFSAMSLLTHHAEHVSEVVIVDNNPGSNVGKSLREFTQNGSSKLRYVPYTAATGTAQPRNEVFRQARSEYVVCIDSHVLLAPGFFTALRDQYVDNPDNPNLFQGPMYYDNLIGLATHFDDAWRGEMWGVWGFDPRVDTQPVFEIPAQGLGMFACRKDAWLGFNERFRGFGGEEWYIHEKYRRAGRKVYCVSGAKWVHRFGRPNGVAYPLTRFNKVRNYCIGLQELGIPLDRCKAHFSKLVTEEEWQAAVRGEEEPAKGCGCKSKTPTLADQFKAVKGIPSDINEHCDTLAELAAGRVVVDAGTRHDVATIALAAGGPSSLRIIGQCGITKQLGPNVAVDPGTSLTVPLSDCDVLFLDSEHTEPHVAAELGRWQGRVGRYIVLHDTVTFPGVMQAVRGFLRSNPQWTVVKHYRNNNGLIVLSRDERDKRPLPSKLKQASNFVGALASHVTGGAGHVSSDRYELRLATCDECPSRNGVKCGECGCPIESKAKLESQSCPLNHW